MIMAGYPANLAAQRHAHRVLSTALVGLALGRRAESTSAPDIFGRPSTHLSPVEENHE
ncbi:hypothetical protein ACWDWU_45090 [Streptomyces sp. NPDC003442]